MHNRHATTPDLLTHNPRSSAHLRGMMWVQSLARVLDGRLAVQDDPTGQAADDRLSLQHAMQLYGIYAETGDERYLSLSEDFLRYSLETAPSRPARTAEAADAPRPSR